MKSHISSTFLRSKMVITTSVLALMVLASGSVALADDDDFDDDGKKVFVSGNSTFSADCGLPGSDFALLLTGDLEGCLSVFVRRFKCKELNAHDGYWEWGREVFLGRLHGKWGKFVTSYTFDAAYAPGYCDSLEAGAPDFSLEVGGGCIHKVRGSRGIFRHAHGEIKFIDVISGVTGDPVSGSYTAGFGANNFVYSGQIRLYDDDD